MWFTIGSTVVVSFFNVYVNKVVCALMCFIVYAASILNILGAFLNAVTWLTLLVLDLLLYLCVPVLFNLISIFVGFPLMGSHGAMDLVYLLLFLQLSFLEILHFLV